MDFAYADSVDLFGIFLAIGGVFVPPPLRPTPLRTGLIKVAVSQKRRKKGQGPMLLGLLHGHGRLHVRFRLVPKSTTSLPGLKPVAPVPVGTLGNCRDVAGVTKGPNVRERKGK